MAIPFAGIATDVSQFINGGTTGTPMTVTGATQNTSFWGNYYASSLYFDGSNDEIVVSDATAFDVENGDFTAECWWNIDAFSGNMRCFSSGNGTSSSHKSHFQFCVLAAGTLRLDYDATAGSSYYVR